ncbi:MAG TPA: pilus assembly protein PilP [Deltaproteobacteria bacterium]|nr:pilus assembly protein PilP [Deltaproteobacteria bacterium]HQI01727.1 pilus assembly protein PilP [Deltaproteobacteria bacterium]
MKGYLSTLIAILSVGVVACSGGGNPSTQTASSASPNAGSAKQEKVLPVLAPEEQMKPAYQIMGLRDPFLPFETSLSAEEARKNIIDPLQRLSLSQVGIVGIILGKDKRALIQEASGIGYIVKEGTLLGENSGIVTAITADGVTVKQHFKDYMGRVTTREIVLSLKKEEGVTGK